MLDPTKTEMFLAVQALHEGCSICQTLLPRLPTLAKAPSIHKGKSLFAEQQYREYKHCPMKGTSSLQDMAAAVSHTNPAKGTTALPGMMMLLLLQNVSTLSNAVQESTGEAILVRSQKQAGGQLVLCFLPCSSPEQPGGHVSAKMGPGHSQHCADKGMVFWASGSPERWESDGCWQWQTLERPSLWETKHREKAPAGGFVVRVSEAISSPGLGLNYSQQTSELLPQVVCKCPTPSPAETGQDQAPAAQGANSQSLGCFYYYLTKDNLQKLSISLPQFKSTAAPQPESSLTLLGK